MSHSIIKEYEVDETKQTLRYHGHTYYWDRDDDWFRVSRHNPKRKHFLKPNEGDRKRIDRLNSIRHRAEKERNDQNYKIVTAIETALDPSSESDAESEPAEEQKDTPWQRHTKQGPPAKGKRIERTKYGVRVYTIDGKTWWDLCVNDSTSYPGATAVRMTLPPPRKDGKRWHMAVFDLETMEAIRREFARGTKPSKK